MNITICANIQMYVTRFAKMCINYNYLEIPFEILKAVHANNAPFVTCLNVFHYNTTALPCKGCC